MLFYASYFYRVVIVPSTVINAPLRAAFLTLKPKSVMRKRRKKKKKITQAVSISLFALNPRTCLTNFSLYRRFY